MSEPGTGMAFLFFGFVLAFFGYVGWQNPEGLAGGNVLMQRGDSEAARRRREGYGRLVGGFFGALGVLLMVWGLYVFVGNLLG